MLLTLRTWLPIPHFWVDAGAWVPQGAGPGWSGGTTALHGDQLAAQSADASGLLRYSGTWT